MNYFIQIDGEPHGPLSADQVRLRITERGLGASDLIRREDGDEWKTLGAMDEFREAMMAHKPAGNVWALLCILFAVVSVPMLLMTLSGDFPPWFWLVALAAVICGHVAVRKIGQSYRREVRGHGMTRAGLRLGYFVVLGVPALSVVFVSGGGGSRISVKGNMPKAISNCRQIITALRIYSGDNCGNYPSAGAEGALTSNDVFRKLFVAGAIDTEMIFGCPLSSLGNPDGNIGTEPDYAEAVKPGENHWAFTLGISDSAPGNIPLVYENVTETTWPPKWNPNLAGKAEPGRTWAGARIIIGFNDSSVQAVKLNPETGAPLPLPDGKPVFPAPEHPYGPYQVLNVAK